MISPLAQALSQLLSEGARAIDIVLRCELEVVVDAWLGLGMPAVLFFSVHFADDDRGILTLTRRIIAEDVHFGSRPAFKLRPRRV